jgi:hypothetical protein
MDIVFVASADAFVLPVVHRTPLDRLGVTEVDPSSSADAGLTTVRSSFLTDIVVS